MNTKTLISAWKNSSIEGLEKNPQINTSILHNICGGGVTGGHVCTVSAECWPGEDEDGLRASCAPLWEFATNLLKAFF